MADYAAWCRENGVVTTFVRFHPFYANHDLFPGFEVVPLGPTVVWRLEGPLREGLHRHHRRAVKKAEAAGISAEIRVGPEGLDEFSTLYEQTMDRQGAAAFYHFSGDYWRALLRLEERLVLAEARRPGLPGEVDDLPWPAALADRDEPDPGPEHEPVDGEAGRAVAVLAAQG
jgi:hypothetical protein